MGDVECKGYRNLVVWQKAMELAKKVYLVTRNFPEEEIYALTSQVRRSAVSVPSNIAEGKGRGTGKEFIQFLRIALGSLYELQTQLELSMRIGYITTAQLNPIDSLALEVEKMLNSLITSTLRR
jgi:four helix bundle protein